jgi:dihydroorotase
LSVNGPAYDLPTCMSKLLHLGMSLRDVVLATTSRPAEILGLEREVGTLRPDSAADIARFRLLPGRFPLYDIAGGMREADRLLVNTLTIVGGRPLDPLPPEPPAPWTEDPFWPEAQVPFTERQKMFRDLGHTPTAMRLAAEANAERE